MKGLFIPEITAEMFRNGCLEAIETLIAEGKIYDIDYDFPKDSGREVRTQTSLPPCEDAVSRFKVLRLIENSSNDLMDSVDNRHLQNEVKKLPPVTPAMLLAKISFDKDKLDEIAKEAARKIKEQLTTTEAAPATPPVTPEPRMGKWLINSDGYYPYCSECKAEPKSGEMTDFCPKCGAKMEGFVK